MKITNGKWLRILVFAACVCLIITCGFIVYTLLKADDLSVTVYVPDKKVVSYYDAVDAISGSYSYPAADQEDWFCTVPLEAALREYEGQDVVYLVGISVQPYPLFERTGESESDDREALKWIRQSILISVEEVTRLTEMGYKVGFLIYLSSAVGGDKYTRCFAGYLTAEQIINFQPREDCGYMFYFPNESVDPRDGIITTY